MKINLLIIVMIKYITTAEFNKLSTYVFNARSTQASLITRRDFDAKLSSLNIKTTANKLKHLVVENDSLKS